MTYIPPELTREPEDPEDVKRRMAAGQRFVDALWKLETGEGDTCPHCQQKIEKMRQEGRCVYCMPCGCRLWQGKIPTAWIGRSK